MEERSACSWVRNDATMRGKELMRGKGWLRSQLWRYVYTAVSTLNNDCVEKKMQNREWSCWRFYVAHLFGMYWLLHEAFYNVCAGGILANTYIVSTLSR